MPIKKSTAGLAVAAGALAVATGVGMAGLAQAEPTPSPGAPSASPSSGQSIDPGRGQDGRGGPGRGHGGFFGGDAAQQLAEKLGVSEAKVIEALEAIREEREADRAAALKGRLDAAVKDGTLTQAEADAVTKAVEKGVIGGGRR